MAQPPQAKIHTPQPHKNPIFFHTLLSQGSFTTFFHRVVSQPSFSGACPECLKHGDEINDTHTWNTNKDFEYFFPKFPDGFQPKKVFKKKFIILGEPKFTSFQ